MLLAACWHAFIVVVCLLVCPPLRVWMIDDANTAIDPPVRRRQYWSRQPWPMYQHDYNRRKSGDSHYFVAYERYMSGCQEQANSCQDFEKDRMERNLWQPRAMQNYSSNGYTKVQVPQIVQDMLTSAWIDHYQDDQTARELWEPGNTRVNHWDSPTYEVDIMHLLSKAQKQNLVNNP